MTTPFGDEALPGSVVPLGEAEPTVAASHPPPEGRPSTALAAAQVHPGRLADPRVAELHRLVDSGEFDLLSLDVFDTLVWRMTPTPIDVFLLIARELDRRGALYESSSPESFVRERINAETRARQKGPSYEVTLDAIYAEFPAGYLMRLTPSEVTEIEVEVESHVVRPNEEMVALLAHARERGLATALVSDTYFSRHQVRALAGVDTDYVIVSCEHGISKYHGLHRVLIDKSRVAPERILHVGDNRGADIDGPEAFGMGRYWLRRFPEEYESMLDAELPSTYARRASVLVSHDAGLSSLRGRAMFACAGPYERWGAGVLGPIVTGFCDWVAERCHELGVRAVLCLMREGRILKQVLDVQHPGLDTREVFLSRFVALKSAIFSGSEQEIAAFVLRPSSQRAGRVLEQLGLEPADCPEIDPESRLAPEETRLLIRRLARDVVPRRKIVESSARARAGLLAHLAPILDEHRGGRVAVVDLGYKGTIQDCLQRILQHERVRVVTHGLYLVTGGDVHVTQSSGAAAEGWLAENGQPLSIAHTFMRSPEVVEQSLMANCGTTVGHDPRGGPVLDDRLLNQDQRRQIAEVQAGLIRYARAWAAHRADHRIDRVTHLKGLIRAICVRAVARPLPIEIELFGGWAHDENFGSRTTRGLTDVAELHDWERDHMSAYQLASLPSGRVYWPFGFARHLGAGMGQAVASIFLRDIEPEVFESAGEARHMVFYLDSGHGLRAEEAAVREYRLNHRGRTWQRFSMKLRDTRHGRYGFSVGLPGEAIQLAGARVHLEPERGESSVADVPHGDFEMHGYRHLHGNLYAVVEDPALLVVPAPDMDHFTGTVHVDLFFSVMGST